MTPLTSANPEMTPATIYFTKLSHTNIPFALNHTRARYWKTRDHPNSSEPTWNYSNYLILGLLSISTLPHPFLLPKIPIKALDHSFPSRPSMPPDHLCPSPWPCMVWPASSYFLLLGIHEYKLRPSWQSFLCLCLTIPDLNKSWVRFNTSPFTWTNDPCLQWNSFLRLLPAQKRLDL